MKRASQERLHALLLHRKHYKWQRGMSRQAAQDLPVNLFRKTLRIFGCCNSRCYLCHAEKLFGFSTLWELKARDKEKDGIAELFESPPQE